MRRATRAAAALGCAAALALTGCGGSDPLGAAEPADAPSGGPAAAGTSVAVGGAPEGIVYDPTTELLAVAVRSPDRLLLLDTTTMRPVRSVPLPGSVRHLQLAATGGPVLVPIESANSFGAVSLPGGRLTVTRVEKQPHDAARTADGTVVVGNEFGRSLSFVQDGAVLGTARDVRQPGGVIADGATVAVVDVARFTLSTYQVATRRRTAVVGAGAGPTHGVLISGDRVLVTDTRGDAARVFSVSPLRQTASLALPGAPYGIAADPSADLVWVTLTARNEVVGLDVSGATPRVVARYPTVRQPNTVAVARGSHTIWVTGTAGGVVETITR